MSSSIIKIIVKVALGSIIIAAVYYFLITPKLSELTSNQKAIAEISSELKKADGKLDNLKTIEKNKTTLDATEAMVNSYLPNDAESSAFIIELEKTSSAIPVIIDSLSVTESKAAVSSSKSTTKTTKAADTSMNFSASLNSSYDNVINFLDKMETLKRFNSIEVLSLTGYNKEKSTMNLKIQGKIYYGK